MSLFAVRRRRRAPPLELPPRLDAVAEALAAGADRAEACAETGRALARDGASLAETLGALEATYDLVAGREPAFADVQALAVAWSEATLSYLHELSCEDPMTGLASLAHVRSRLAELYRGELREPGRVARVMALVVVDLPHDRHGMRRPSVLGQGHDGFTRALRIAQLGETARTVFAGSETLGRVGLNRVVVLARRDDRLGRRVSLLRSLLAGLDLAGHRARVWIEGLPATDETAARLLDELSRP